MDRLDTLAARQSDIGETRKRLDTTATEKSEIGQIRNRLDDVVYQEAELSCSDAEVIQGLEAYKLPDRKKMP